MAQDKKSPPPLSGKLVTAVINNFARKPMQGDDSWEDCSIGVGAESIVATDSHSGIIIGGKSDGHQATKRKEAELEAIRAQRYGVAVRLDTIERNVDPKKNNEVRPMPPVQAIVRQRLGAMKPLAAINPRALLAIAKVASAAGALSVDLFQPTDGEATEIGFHFRFSPEAGHIDLFNPFEGDIEALGVVKVGKGAAGSPVDDDEAEAPKAEEPKAEEEPKAVDAPAAPAPVATPEPEPLPPVDVEAELERGAYKLPAVGLLDRAVADAADSGDYSAAIVEALLQHAIPVRVVGSTSGPTVTLYEVEIPPKIPLKRIVGMAADLKVNLGVASVRIEPIPGKRAYGIEIPNAVPRTVSIFELCASRDFTDSGTRLLMAVGQDVAGGPVYYDLAKTPHLLVAGTTGSGKSIGVASMLTSLLLRNTPKDVRFVMIDPKRVELKPFDGIPHLMCPVVTDVKEVAGVLRAVWREMERRYTVCEEAGVRNIDGFNKKASENERMPSIVVVVDELADLMLQVRDEVEDVIQSLVQKARAVGIHLILATQRPSVDVITGVIKANVPSRIAFAVMSGVDSKVILDATGAENLLGKGDMLFSPVDASRPLRLQGAYVSEEDIAKLCQYWRAQAKPVYEIHTETKKNGSREDRYPDALVWAAEKGEVSTSMLQRQFSIGFQAASHLLERMEKDGHVTERDGPKPRQVKISPEEAREVAARHE